MDKCEADNWSDFAQAVQEEWSSQPPEDWTAGEWFEVRLWLVRALDARLQADRATLRPGR